MTSLFSHEQQHSNGCAVRFTWTSLPGRKERFWC
jgi:hypothetical protein